MPERFILRPIFSIFNLRTNNKGISRSTKREETPKTPKIL